MLFMEKDHAANPPSTWLVVKAAPRLWNLTTKDGGVIESRTTKKDAESLTQSGWLVSLYEKEGRWFAGESIPGWKPYVRPSEANR
jgi:hypothetical protein